MKISGSWWNAEERLEYCDAMEYIFDYWGNFPMFIPHGGPTPEISKPLFKNWRFVLTHDGEIVFGNCMVPPIRRAEYEEYCRAMSEEVWHAG